MLLNAWNMSNGNVEIHAAGCNHKPGSRTRRTGVQQQDQVEFGKVDWPTRTAFCYDYWNNGILDEHEAEHGPGSFDVLQCMDFAPCTKALPWGSRDNMEEDKVADSTIGKPVGSVPAPSAHLKSNALPGGLCRCTCGNKVGRGSTFKQGHDARWISDMVQLVANKKLSRKDAARQVGEVSDKLAAKLAALLDKRGL